MTVTGEISDNPFQYTGRENDGTGLYYYRARYYSPELQRFISEDPIGLAGGDVNFFAYVGNDPVNWVDQLGLTRGDWWDPRTWIDKLFNDGHDNNVDLYEQKIVARAATWEGTPYKSPGTTKKGADCTGSTWAIYNGVGLDYPHKYSAVNFPKYSQFEEVSMPRPGDVVWWKGHVAIYVDETYVWSARRPRYSYGKFPVSWFNKRYGPPKYYHYKR